MGWKLDDNTRSGLHYLVLGVLVIASLRLLWWGMFALAYHGLSAGEIAFKNGFLGLERSTLVVSGSTAIERVLTALIIVVTVALGAGLIAGAIGRERRTKWFRTGVVASAVLALPWAFWAALLAPLKYTTIGHDSLVIHYNRELLFDLPTPFGGTVQPLDREEIAGFKPGEGGVGHTRTATVADIRLDDGEHEEVIGTVHWKAGSTSRKEAEALRDSMLLRLSAHFDL